MSRLCTEYGVLTIPPYRMRNESGKSTESGLEYAKELEGYWKDKNKEREGQEQGTGRTGIKNKNKNGMDEK